MLRISPAQGGNAAEKIRPEGGNGAENRHFTKDGRTIRFFTRRGPRISLDEVLSGANEFEIDACFVNEHGHSLIVVAGGHENTMPECPDVMEGRVEGEGADDKQGQDVAMAAMEVLLSLPFQERYRGEQRVLTGTLEFLRRPPAVGMAVDSGGGTLEAP